MGGFGSGRPGWRGKVEHARKLDVNRLHRTGCLRPGHFGGWQWTRDGEPVATINLRMRDAALMLSFRWRQYGGEWESVEQPAPVTWASCGFGGFRPYFLCPGVVNGRACGRRVGALYAAGRYFLCRQCYRLSYASQSEDRHDRLMRKANRRRVRLGGEPGWDAPITKPKGMWRRTFEREVAMIEAAEMEADRAFAEMAARRFGGRDLAELLG